MPTPSNADADPGDHRFTPQTASPALKAAVTDLAGQTGRPESEFAGMTLNELFRLATENYQDGLPEFWRVWQSWQSSSFDPPAEMGDL
jgi:hypothetical protein